MSQQGTKVAPKKVGLISAIALGVGGMMGAGLYTLLGLAATTAGPWIPIAFLIAGFAASFSVYSYAKMGAQFPSSGGAATFIITQFGHGTVSGGVNVFQYISYLIATALYAAGFSDYASALLGSDVPAWLPQLIGPGIIVLFTVINIFGSQLVGKAESYIVVIELVILAAFLVYGMFHADPTTFLSGEHKGSFLGILTASGLLYVTYQGFGVVANASAEMDNPKKLIPRAMFIALGVVTFIYLAVSTLSVFIVPDTSLVKDAGHVLADAGSVLAGRLGFVIISGAAILATASAVNATVFAASKIGSYLAEEKQLPQFFGRTAAKKIPLSLIISSALVIVLVWFFPLSAVGQMTSLAFLLVYAVVSLGHLRVRNQTGAKAWPLVVAIVVNVLMFILLFVDAVTTGPVAAWITLIAALLGSFVYSLFTRSKKA